MTMDVPTLAAAVAIALLLAAAAGPRGPWRD